MLKVVLGLQLLISIASMAPAPERDPKQLLVQVPVPMLYEVPLPRVIEAKLKVCFLETFEDGFGPKLHLWPSQVKDMKSRYDQF